jgi:hypothetical protein
MMNKIPVYHFLHASAEWCCGNVEQNISRDSKDHDLGIGGW